MSQGVIPLGSAFPVGRTAPAGAPADAPDRAGGWVREGLCFLGLLVLARVSVLWLLYVATGGREFTDDLANFALMLRSPLGMLTGEAAPGIAHFPPLLPLMLSPVLVLWSLLGKFLSFRVLFLGYEILAWWMVWLILCHAVPRAASRRLLALAYIASPMAWMTSVVMGQEETLGLMFAAAVVLALLRDRRLLALTLCSLAACASKVFFVVPLAVLILVPQEGRSALRGLLVRALVGLAPVTALYTCAALVQHFGAHGVSLAHFDPPIMFCVSLWTALSNLQPLPTRFMEYASGTLAAGSIAAVMLAIRIHRVPLGGAGIARVACALLLCLYATFYHVNPEYYALAVPMLLLMFRPVWSALVLVGGLWVPWAVNLVYGIATASAAHAPRKQAFVDAYRSITSIDPTALYAVLLWLCVALMLGLAGAAVRGLLEHRRARLLPAG